MKKSKPVDSLSLLPAWLEQFKRERRAGVPLVAVSTPDVPASARSLIQLCGDSTPCAVWSCSSGVVAGNEAGRETVVAISNGLAGMDPTSISNLGDLLIGARATPERSVVLILNAHLHWSGVLVRDAIQSLRDPFKENQRTLVLLAGDVADMPREFVTDTRVLRESMPNRQERALAIARLYTDAAADNKLPDLSEEKLGDASSATAGLTGFAVEQATAVAIRRVGLDVADLRATSREAINSRKGLRVSDEKVTFADVGGLGALASYIRALAKGPDKFSLVVLWDEVEKMLAGSGGGDLSGVAADILGVLLTWIERRRVHGILLMGPPGSGKSLSAQAAAGEHGVPLVWMDIGAMKGSLVGESGANLRAALETIDAVSEGQVLLIATCNGVGELKPELLRRFKPRFMVDLPGASELEAIWSIQTAANDIESDAPRPDASGWTGAEVRDACRIARATGTTPREAARFVIPLSESSKEAIERVRREAVGRFVDAGAGGPYRGPAALPPAIARAGKAPARKLEAGS